MEIAQICQELELLVHSGVMLGDGLSLLAEEEGGELSAGVPPCNCAEEGYAYTCPISETQRLCVELHCDDGEWTVLRWQAESVARWENDESLNLWDGT